MKLRAINLNLLKTLSVLLKTRSVTIASQTLYLTQPAVSGALKQLRILFNDELLVKRNAKLFDLTHKAKIIKPALEQWLIQAENLVHIDTQKVIPEKLERTFYIGLHSYVSSLIFPALHEKLKKIAPNVKILQKQVPDFSELTSAELNQFDFLIGAFHTVPKQYRREFYFSDRFVCLSGVRKLNRQKKLTIDDLKNHEHVLLSHSNNYSRSVTEAVMRSNGINRKYKMIVGDTLLASQLAAAQSLLLVILKKRADFFKNIFPLKIFELPFQSPEIKTEIIYKEIDRDDPVKQWFKSLLLDLI